MDTNLFSDTGVRFSFTKYLFRFSAADNNAHESTRQLVERATTRNHNALKRQFEATTKIGRKKRLDSVLSVSNSNTSVITAVFWPKITTTIIVYTVQNSKSNTLQ